MSAETVNQTPLAPPMLRVEVEQHTAAIIRLDLDRDERFLVTGSHDKKARLWDLRLEELVKVACRTAGRNLTKEEWQLYMGNQLYQRTCPNLP
jgi:hypothetical protein